MQHLEHAYFECRAETIFDTAQNAISIVAVALELQNDIDDMFQNLRSRDCSLFGNVAYDENWNAAAFGIFEQRCGTFANLRHTPCRRVDKVGVHRLNRVDDHHVGTYLVNLRHDVFEQCLRVDDALLVADADTLGTQFDLLCRLLARDIQRLQSVVRQGYLQRQRRFADTGFATEQNQRACHNSAAQHTIDLAIARIDALRGAALDFGYALRTRCRYRFACNSRRNRAALFGYNLFGKRVPCSARWAFAEPLGCLETALATKICLFDLCHDHSFVFILIAC